MKKELQQKTKNMRKDKASRVASHLPMKLELLKKKATKNKEKSQESVRETCDSITNEQGNNNEHTEVKTDKEDQLVSTNEKLELGEELERQGQQGDALVDGEEKRLRKEKERLALIEETKRLEKDIQNAELKLAASRQNQLTQNNEDDSSDTENEIGDAFVSSIQGKRFFTGDSEDQNNIGLEKPSWATKQSQSSLLKSTDKTNVIKSGGNLSKPITFPADKGNDLNTLVLPEGVLKPTTNSEIIQPKIEWEKPTWAQRSPLKATKKGSAIKSGIEITRPITHINA